MQIAVAYVEAGEQFWQQLDVPEASRVQDAIERSGLLRRFPDLDLSTRKVGIFGKVVRLDTALQAGDRVEVYRAITCDPQTVPRRDQGDPDAD